MQLQIEKVVYRVYFKGRTVITFVLLTMIASAVVTITLADQWIGTERSIATVAAASDGKAGSLSQEETAKINAVLELIETKFYEEVDRTELLDGAVSGIMKALGDPYSVYMEKDDAQHFSESIEGSFSGIGAEVSMDNSKIIVVSPIKGSPAERSGMLPKDVLLSVNGESLEGLNLQEAVAKIRGPKGTKAKIMVQRAGVTEPIQLVLVRDDIDVETVYADLREDGVGVIEIRQFSMNTAKRFKEELEKLEEQGLSGLVIDVRNNPGGVLPVVVEMSQLMLKQGSTVVQVEDRDGKREKTSAKGGEQKSYPIAVLTNKGSASASEILAGALQEGAGATVVGEKSFGKGTVQVSYNKTLGDGSLVKMTIAKWLTPDGNWIHGEGIKPDIEIAPHELYTVARLSITETIKPDSYSETVRSAQVMLHGLGFDPGRVDGYYSTNTVKAVKAFQEKHALKATGELNKETAEKLELDVISWLQKEENDNQLQEAIKAVGRK